MKPTNKTELLNSVLEILSAHKAKPALIEDITNLLKPKTGGGISYPPKEIEGVWYHRCRYTELYLPESEMVLSNGKSKGYSKLAIGLWTKLGRDAQKLNDEAMKALLNGDTEHGKALAIEAEALKTNRNNPEMYDDVRAQLQDLAK